MRASLLLTALAAAALVACQSSAHPTCAETAARDVRACYTRDTVTLARWHGETFVTIRGPIEADARPDLSPLATDAGFEVGAWLSAPPASNVLHWHLETNAAVSRQPLLAHVTEDGASWEANGRGGIRRSPAGVGGSYVFYHPTQRGDYTRLGGQNYRAGKAFHLYRPWVQDAEGASAWAEVSLDRDTLTVTIPADFLAHAAYPVWVDPTFGYTTHGGSTDNNASLPMYFFAHSTPVSNGTITAITHYHTSAGTDTFDTAVYSNSAGAPNSRLAQTQPGTTNSGTPNAEVTTSLSLVITSGTQYWLGMLFVGSAPDYAFDALGDNGGNGFKWDNSATTTWPASANSGGTGADEVATVYATYTASGGSPTYPNNLTILGAGPGQ